MQTEKLKVVKKSRNSKIGGGGVRLMSSEVDDSEVQEAPSEKPWIRWFLPFQLFYVWLFPILIMGYRKVLELKDLPKLPLKYRAGHYQEKFSKRWEKCKHMKSPWGVIVAAYGCFWLDFVVSGIYQLLTIGLTIGYPFCLGKLLSSLQPIITDSIMADYELYQTVLPVDIRPTEENYMTMYRENDYMVWVWLTAMIAFQLGSLVFEQFTTYETVKIGMKIKTVMTSKLYEKSLKLSNAARKRCHTGKIISLLTGDLIVLEYYTARFHYAWGSVVILTIVFVMLGIMMGLSVVFSIVVAICIVPIVVVINVVFYLFRKKYQTEADKRIVNMTEIFGGIQIIKFFNWEIPYLTRIMDTRKKQVVLLRIAFFFTMLQDVCIVVAPPLMMCSAFLWYFFSGNQLTTVVVLTAMGYFNLTRAPLIFFPEILTQLATALMSLTRLQNFLKEEESESFSTDGGLPDTPVVIDASFQWDISKNGNGGGKRGKGVGIGKKSKKKEILEKEEDAKDEKGDPKKGKEASKKKKPEVGKLENIKISIPKGSCVLVVGRVGAGKSSLFSAILGEMKKTEGELKISGSVAFTAQSPWIQHSTFLENVLFHKEMDEEKFNKIIHCVDLEADLKQIKGGRLAEIGERGINLSGGQKYRVSLARALYQDPDIFLFDDPLAAVDSHVGKHLWETMIKGYLKGKTIIMATHQLQYCSEADLVIYLKEGKISGMGKYDDLMKTNKEFEKLVTKNLSKLVKVKGKKTKDEVVKKEMVKTKKGKMTKIIKKEERSVGSVKWHVFHSYIKNTGGYCCVAMLLCIFFFCLFIYLFTEWWITNFSSRTFFHEKWENSYNLTYYEYLNGSRTYYNSSLPCPDNFAEMTFCRLDTIFIDWQEYSNGNMLEAGLTTFQSIMIYMGLSLFIPLIYVFRGVLNFNMLVTTSSKLFKKAVKRIIRAPMSFFWSNPAGRIMNRFSNDVFETDIGLTLFIYLSLGITFTVIGSQILVAIVSWGLFVPIMLLILVLFYGVFHFFRKTSRELKRMENVLMSPFLSHVAETLQGISTIRAYKSEGNFIKKNRRKYDLMNRSHYITLGGIRWIIIYLNLIGFIVVILTTSVSVVLAYYLDDWDVPISFLGLAITRSSSTAFLFCLSAFFILETEVRMNSVERLVHYGENIPVEEDKTTFLRKRNLKKGWAHSGTIEFKNYSLRYRNDLPWVLKGLTCKMIGSKSVGIVGRTGAGKSSIMLGLTRIVESGRGKILIDGQDISKLTLKSLRSEISVIPQDPKLFSGNVRSNIDPFDKYTDEECWDAIRKAHLFDVVEKLDGKLLGVVDDEGKNFSLGEKQLFCLARSLLENCKVLLLDECTASVDFETDRIVQSTIRREFKGTILTIAHRLSTVVDYDMILVVDNGEIADYDTPAKLISRKGIFLDLVNQTRNPEYLKNKILGSPKENQTVVEEVESLTKSFALQKERMNVELKEFEKNAHDLRLKTKI